MRKAFTGFLLVMLTCQLHAGGYQVSLHGQKQIGMGLIGTSLAMDGSSSFYNPGALAMMPDNYSILAGMSAISSYNLFHMQGTLYEAKTENPIGTPFYFYGAGRITDNLVAGIAVNTPYGNKLAWEDGWAGRYLIEEISLQAITIQPTLSYMMNDMISFGAGFIYTTGSVDLTRALPVEGQYGEGSLNIKGSASNWGFNAGILIKPVPDLNIGISYRSKIEMELEDADAIFDVPLSLQTQFPADNKVAVALPLPANLDFGVSYNVSEALMVGLALNYVFWETYDKLVFDFETNTLSLQDSENPREYSNKLIIRAGGQYKASERLFIRMGAYYDPSPVNELYFTPETPSVNNIGITAGLSYAVLPGMTVDVSFLYVHGMEMEAEYSPENFAGKYKSRAFIPGIGISYNF